MNKRAVGCKYIASLGLARRIIHKYDGPQSPRARVPQSEHQSDWNDADNPDAALIEVVRERDDGAQ